MTEKQTKDFNYWVGLSSDGTNVSAKDRATFLTELKKRYFDVAKENMKISVLEQSVSALELENEEMKNLNKDLTEENVKLKQQIEKMKCCTNCKYFDFEEPNYCHKGVIRKRHYVCSKWEFREE